MPSFGGGGRGAGAGGRREKTCHVTSARISGTRVSKMPPRCRPCPRLATQPLLSAPQVQGVGAREPSYRLLQKVRAARPPGGCHSELWPEQRHLQPIQAADGAPLDRPRLVRYWYALSRSVLASGALGPPTGAQVEDPLLASSCLTGRSTEPITTCRSNFSVFYAPLHTLRAQLDHLLQLRVAGATSGDWC